jgi:hypothetical protein
VNVIVTLLSLLGACSFIGTGIVAWANRKKVRGEAAKAGADAAAVLTGSALSIVEDLRGELRSARAEIRALRSHLGVVERLLRSQGTPIPEFDWPPRTNGVA